MHHDRQSPGSHKEETALMGRSQPVVANFVGKEPACHTVTRSMVSCEQCGALQGRSGANKSARALVAADDMRP
jgi:hypothetical protein